MGSGVPASEQHAIIGEILDVWSSGGVPADGLLHRLDALGPEALPDLLAAASELRDLGRGRRVTYSRKVFIPLTHLCRDVCHYCTFARPPRPGEPAFLDLEGVLAIARAGAAAGCHEALFTLGDKPELRWREARSALADLGHSRTLDYLASACGAVIGETGLLPHANAGVMDRNDILMLRRCCPSQGIMLETASERLSAPGGPHAGSPDKAPAARLATLEAAGEARVPFTTGILIGIGETRAERVDSLLAIAALHRRFGHIQEVIVQNFRAKPGTAMAHHPEPDAAEMLWSTAVARLVLGPEANLQAPPNLTADFGRLLDAGINDWGGVSPVTIDHVNPEAPWPAIERLRQVSEAHGFALAERLTVYPEYALDAETWLAPEVRTAVVRASDAEGLAYEGAWFTGAEASLPLAETAGPEAAALLGEGEPRRGAATPDLGGATATEAGDNGQTALGGPAAAAAAAGEARARGEAAAGAAGGPAGGFAAAGAGAGPELLRRGLGDVLERAAAGADLSVDDVVQILTARGPGFAAVCGAADELRSSTVGDDVTYIVTRNINYTNICYFRCGFCAFSQGKLAENLRGRPYLVPTEEVLRRCREAWERGATEVCMQGGIHPAFTGAYYLDLLAAVKRELPRLHVHAFSPLEVWQGAATLGVPVPEFLRRLKDAGLGSLPGTAAEVLDDEVRAVLCPDKLKTAQWAYVVEEAHRAGLATTSTIMFGHVDHPWHWARHLLLLRDIQRRTGGFTEIVPLPFVHMEAPLYLKGRARRGPTFREAVLIHAASRLALHPVIPHVQASWVKMGLDGAQACLRAGADDMGGTLMNESISRAAGASHGQEVPPEAMEAAIRAIGRRPRQRTTLYRPAPEERRAASFAAPPMLPVVPGYVTA